MKGEQVCLSILVMRFLSTISMRIENQMKEKQNRAEILGDWALQALI